MAAGVNELYLSDGGAAWPSSPVLGTNVFALGYAEEKKIEIKNAGMVGKDIQFPSLIEIILSAKAQQISAAFFKFLMNAWIANDVSVKAITGRVSKATDFTSPDGIFTFDNIKSMGIEWALKLSPTERYIQLTLGRGYKPSDAVTIISNGPTDTLPGTLNIPALDIANTLKAYINPPFGAITIADDRLNNWSIDIKTRAKKNSMQKARGNIIEVDIMGVMDDVSPAEINTFMAAGIAPDLTIAVGVDTPWNLVLKTGGLSQYGEGLKDEDNNTATVHFKGIYTANYADLTGAGVTLNAKL